MHIARRLITFTVIDIRSQGLSNQLTLDEEQIDKLQEHLNILCNEYGIEYADASVPDRQLRMKAITHKIASMNNQH